MFALVDCNNFYASCEKLFRPDLKDTPVVVLSNNDGCIVARSKEVKEFDMPMAAPFFKHKKFLESKGTAFFSSNYALYGDISNRVVEVLGQFSPVVEQYSIDEAFIDLSGVEISELSEWSEELVRTVFAWVGINVSVGIAETKTLAKIANHRAKKNKMPATILINNSDISKELSSINLTDIWGISGNLERKLNRYNIWSPLDLKDADPFMLRKKIGIVVERTSRELSGEVCLELEQVEKRKNIRVSRSFGTVTSDYAELEQATATFTARACEKLRKQKSLANGLYLFLRTNKHADLEYYSASSATGFIVPTNSSFDIVSEAQKLLAKVYRPGFLFQKVGVMLLDLVGEGAHQQQDIFGITKDITNKTKLMKTIDKINREMGRGSLKLASQGLEQRGWKLRAEYLSPRYTTSWDDIPKIK